MFSPTSRYAKVETATFLFPDGRQAIYARRRFLPPLSDRAGAEASTLPGERLDHLAQRTLGDPLAYWRLCDANEAMDPAQLAPPLGRRVRLPPPEGRA